MDSAECTGAQIFSHFFRKVGTSLWMQWCIRISSDHRFEHDPTISSLLIVLHVHVPSIKMFSFLCQVHVCN